MTRYIPVDPEGVLRDERVDYGSKSLSIGGSEEMLRHTD